jgi:GT2 family glycosyltransferase
MIELEIVIVNYRTGDLVLDCLRSLVGEIRGGGLDGHVVVVTTPPGTVRSSGSPVRSSGGWAHGDVIALEENGVRGRNNAAPGPAGLDRRPHYVLLLNPDTVVRLSCALVDFMEHNPQTGLAGSRLEDPDGTPQRSAFRFPTVASEFERGIRLGLVSRLLHRYVVAPPLRDVPHPADWVAGASLMVRRAVFEAIGLLDSSYFLYFEEVDFAAKHCGPAGPAGTSQPVASSTWSGRVPA